MQRKTPLYVDHFGWATMDEPKTIDFFEKMGFYMGDKRPEGDKSFYMSHFYFDSDSSYINIYQLPEDGNMWPIKLDWVQQPDENMPIRERLSDPRGITGVYTFCISTRDCDESYAAAVEAGYKVCKVYRRPDEPYYYTTIGGSVQDDMFAFDLGVEPFPNMMIGVMEHFAAFPVISSCSCMTS